MKGFARRNQLIITGLAIMIAVAGYLHFTSEGGAGLSEAETEKEQENKWLEKEDAQAYLLTDDDDSIETMTEDTETKQKEGKGKEKKEKEDEDKGKDAAMLTEDEYADLSAEDLGTDEDGEKAVAENSEKKDNKQNKTEEGQDSVETIGEEIAEAGGSIGEAVLVNNTLEGDYFSSAKLSREQARARNEETLMEIVNNAKMEEEQKKEAVNSLIHLTEISEMETATETLLGAKGFENTIVTMTSDSVDVVVDAEGLTKQQIVQIQDIVKRKTKIPVENIVITTVAVKN